MRIKTYRNKSEQASGSTKKEVKSFGLVIFLEIVSFDKIIIQLEKQSNSDSLKRSLGSLITLFVGNAIGIHAKDAEKESNVEAIYRLQTQGTYDYALGQISAPGEMSLALANALSEGKGVLNLDKILAAFVSLHKSGTENASIKHFIQLSEEDIVTNAYQISKREFTQTETNVCLMRLVPLAIWGQNLDRD